MSTCGAITRAGSACRLPAGHGTRHPGHGRCRRHAGNTPNGIRAASRAEAVSVARQFLDSPAEIEPLDAALFNVQIAHSMVSYRRAKLNALEAPTPEDEKALEEALVNSQRIVDIAIRAGVAEKLVAITQRMAERITLAAEEALKAVEMSAQARVQFAAEFARAIARMEGEPIEAAAPLQLTNGDGGGR